MQVPNRYYNSPWIADAARNLSIALYGDPEKDAQRDRMNFEMQRAKEADARALEDRSRAERGRTALAALATDPRMSDAILQGVDPAAARLVSGQTFDEKQSLQDAKLSAALDNMNARMGQAEQLANMRDQTQRDLASLRDQTQRYGIDARTAIAEELAKLRANERAPIDISPTEANNLKLNVAELAQEGYGGSLDPRLLQEIAADAQARYQRSRNAGTAAREAFVARMGSEPTLVRERSGFFDFGEPDGAATLAPNLSAPVTAQPTPSPVGGSMSGVMLRQPGATPPARLPVMNSPAEARAKLQPGQQFTTPDGRVMTRK